MPGLDKGGNMLDRLRRVIGIAFGEGVLENADPDDLFDISTGYVTLGANGYESRREAAVCVGTVDTTEFAAVLEDVDALLDLDGASPKNHLETDASGYTWAVFENEDFEGLVTEVYGVVDTLLEAGAGDYLLAAVFAFENETRAYWIYNFKRGTWYPFVPRGRYTRDTDTEDRLRELLATELDLEEKANREYPFWDLPI